MRGLVVRDWESLLSLDFAISFGRSTTVPWGRESAKL